MLILTKKEIIMHVSEKQCTKYLVDCYSKEELASLAYSLHRSTDLATLEHAVSEWVLECLDNR